MDMVCTGSRQNNSSQHLANFLQVLANLLSLAAVCPFVGSLSDLIGRRYVALTGGFFLILGMIVASTAKSMNIFICKFLKAYISVELRAELGIHRRHGSSRSGRRNK